MLPVQDPIDAGFEEYYKRQLAREKADRDQNSLWAKALHRIAHHAASMSLCDHVVVVVGLLPVCKELLLTYLHCRPSHGCGQGPS